VLARAGDLQDSSMEVSLLSAVMAIHSAGIKVSRFMRQEALGSYHVFRGGDHDLLLVPVNASYALMLAGSDLAARERILNTVDGLAALRGEVEKSLKSLGVGNEAAPAEAPAAAPAPAPASEAPSAGAKKKRKTSELPPEPPSAEMEALLKDAGKKKIKAEEMDAFWDQAAEKHGNAPTNPDVITYEQARQLGLAPGEEEK
jgi:hypothetical protein